MTDNELIARLQTLASNFLRVPFPKERPFDGATFTSNSGIVIGHPRLDLEEFVGFTATSAPALLELANGLRSADPQYKANSEKTKFKAATTSAVLTVLQSEPAGVAIGATQLASVRLHLANWWSTQLHDRCFPIPCVLTPYQSKAFSIGPVKFQYARDWDSARKPQFPAFEYGIAMNSYFEQIGHRAAHWIAEVRIAGRELSKAQAVADLATDVAIASIQLLHPGLFGNAARITGRAMPVVRMDVSFDSSHIYGGVKNLEPGRSMTPTTFDNMILQFQPFLSSAGRRIDAFVNGGSTFPQLDQSWCDAALWFHEGVADTLNTVAVAKMETAIEVLLCATSTKKSNKRLRDAFWAFRNKGPEEELGPGLPTVGDLVAQIVTARSRVLHGTLSTMEADTDEERLIAQGLAQELLIAYCGHLENYIKSPGAQDDTDAFLAWIHSQLYTKN
jgi:hypothetical protein